MDTRNQEDTDQQGSCERPACPANTNAFGEPNTEEADEQSYGYRDHGRIVGTLGVGVKPWAYRPKLSEPTG